MSNFFGDIEDPYTHRAEMFRSSSPSGVEVADYSNPEVERWGPPIYRRQESGNSQSSSLDPNMLIALSLLQNQQPGESRTSQQPPHIETPALPAAQSGSEKAKFYDVRAWEMRRKIGVGVTALLLSGGGIVAAQYGQGIKDSGAMIAAEQLVSGDGSDVTLKTMDCNAPAMTMDVSGQADIMWQINAAPPEEIAKKEADPKYALQTTVESLGPLAKVVGNDTPNPAAPIEGRYLQAMTTHNVNVHLCDPESTAVNMRNDDTATVDLSSINLTTFFPVTGQAGFGSESVEGLKAPFPKLPVFTAAEHQRLNAAINSSEHHAVIQNGLKRDILIETEKQCGNEVRILAKEAITAYLRSQADKQGIELTIDWNNDFRSIDSVYTNSLDDAGIAYKSPDLTLGEVKAIKSAEGTAEICASLESATKE